MSRFSAKTHGRTFVLLYTGVLVSWSCWGDLRAQDDTVQRLTATILGGPMIYRTPEAIEYYTRRGLSKGLAEQQQKRDDAIRGFRAAIKLGEMGTRAKPAVPVLIDMFPQLEHVVTKRGVHYTTGNGSLEDWVQTFLVSEKSNFVFSSPFVEFETMSKCENSIEATPDTKLLYQKMGASGRIVEAVADIFIILRVNAGACALSRITGKEFGADREAWQRWWSQEAVNKGVAQTVRPSATSRKKTFGEVRVGGSYKLHLVTGEDLSGTVTFCDDTSLVLKTESGTPYSVEAVLVDKYEVVAAAPSESNPVVPNAPAMQSHTLTFDDLARGSLNGKVLEIQIKNGSVFRGIFIGVSGETARINVEGSEIPVSRGVITKIALIQK